MRDAWADIQLRLRVSSYTEWLMSTKGKQASILFEVMTSVESGSVGVGSDIHVIIKKPVVPNPSRLYAKWIVCDRHWFAIVI